MDTQKHPGGRRKGTEHGDLRAAVLRALQEEDPTNPLTDLAVAAREGITESAVSQARRALFLPPAKKRARAYKQGVRLGNGIAQCRTCVRVYTVPDGAGGVYCPVGHGRLTLSSYRLVIPD